MDTNFDLYSILGVDKGASLDEIKKARNDRIKKAHPDSNKESMSDNEEVIKINLAYSILSDEYKRASYDESGSVDDNLNLEAKLAKAKVEAKGKVLELFLSLVENGDLTKNNIGQTKQLLASILRQANINQQASLNTKHRQIERAIETITYALDQEDLEEFIEKSLKSKLYSLRVSLMDIEVATQYTNMCLVLVNSFTFKSIENMSIGYTTTTSTTSSFW